MHGWTPDYRVRLDWVHIHYVEFDQDDIEDGETVWEAALRLSETGTASDVVFDDYEILKRP
jgi:hypothetical protein